MTPSSDIIRILLVEDHISVREGYKSLIERSTRFKVIGEVGNGREALDFLKENEADIVLLDMEMPVMNGYEAIKIIQIRFPKLKVIVLSLHEHVEFINECLNLGALACLGKSSTFSKISTCIQKVHEEGLWVEPEIMKQVLQHQNDQNTANRKFSNKELSPKEKNVAVALCEGKSEKEVAVLLNISESTVHFHKQRIFLKTGTKKLAELIYWALRHNLVNSFGKALPGSMQRGGGG